MFLDPTSFPKSLLVKVVEDEDEGDSYLVAAANADELPDDGRTKVARYVLAGVGRIKQTAAVYVEDAKA